MVWSYLALALNNTTLMYIRNDCTGKDGYGDGAKAWKLLQEKYCSAERPTVVSLVGQLAKLKLGSDEKLDDYFVRSQELMTRLCEAGEVISDTLFNALVINGLPESYEHFVVQESFQPASSFPELRTRLRNYHDSRNARQEDTDSGHYAMPTVRNKKLNRGACFVCGRRGHISKECRSRSNVDKSSRGVGGSSKGNCFNCGKEGHFARDCQLAKAGSDPKTNFFTCCASELHNKDSFIVDSGCTDHVVNNKDYFVSMEAHTDGVTVKNPNGSDSAVIARGTVDVELQDTKGMLRPYRFNNIL